VLKINCIKCFQMTARRPNLRPFRSITRALQVSDDEDSAEESYSEEDEDFVVSVEDTTEETSAEEGDGEEAEVEEVEAAEGEEDDDFNDEAEPVNKKKRVIDSVVRQRKRGRPRKSISASKGFMIWTENVPTQITRRSFDTSFSAAPQNNATTITSPLEGFKVLFTDEMINLIVLHTNERIDISVRELKAKNHVIQSYHAPTDKIEIEAYIGINFYAAVYKDNRQDVMDMFSYDCGRQVYNSTFSLQRFKFLTSCSSIVTLSEDT